MAITPQLLDALLSPECQQAEGQLQSMTRDDRAKGFLQFLLTENEENARSMMAAVLLRRDLAGLAASLLLEMAEPVLNLFVGSNQIKRQIGYCLAELCASLTVSSASDAEKVVKGILEKLAPAVSLLIIAAALYYLTLTNS